MTNSRLIGKWKNGSEVIEVYYVSGKEVLYRTASGSLEKMSIAQLKALYNEVIDE